MNGIALRLVRAVEDLRRLIKTPISVPTMTRHKGEIHSTSPLTVWLDGNTAVPVPVTKLAGYTPTIGDQVYITNVAGDHVVHDKYG